MLEFVPVFGLTTFELIEGLYLSIYLKLVGCFNLFITYLSNNLSSIKLGLQSAGRSLLKGLLSLFGSSPRLGGRWFNPLFIFIRSSSRVPVGKFVHSILYYPIHLVCDPMHI
jgi:hypothetical protein